MTTPTYTPTGQPPDYMAILCDTHRSIMEILRKIEANDSQTLGVPRKKVEDMEATIERISNSMQEFTYDLNTNNTFKRWYNRYKATFKKETTNLDDQAKVRLLLRKFDLNAYEKFTSMILPLEPSDLTFDETVKKLMKIFSRRESVFRLRYNSMIINKRDDVDILTYYDEINSAVEAIEYDKMTIEQYKCTLFVKGLVSNTELDKRTKLLSLLETDKDLTMEKLLDEYERITNLKLDTTIPQQQQQGSVLINKVTSKKELKKSKN